MIFGKLNPEKIWYENFTDLSTSSVRCSHFTLGNEKNVIFNSLILIIYVIYTQNRLIFDRVIRKNKKMDIFGDIM